jgi:hypothetical protein
VFIRAVISLTRLLPGVSWTLGSSRSFLDYTPLPRDLPEREDTIEHSKFSTYAIPLDGRPPIACHRCSYLDLHLLSSPGARLCGSYVRTA